MDYERKDSNAKAKSGKEPQVLHPYNGKKKMTRREMLFKAMKGAKWNLVCMPIFTPNKSV